MAASPPLELMRVTGLALVLGLGVGAQWLAWRLRFPSILVLLLAGLAAGPGAELAVGARLLDPDALFGDLLQPVTSVAVGIVLYEGGLSLRLREIGESRAAVRNLVTIGAAVTWLSSATAAYLLGLCGAGTALLLGAILVVTGPTVIIPLLRDLRFRGRVGPILKWEGIVSDPLGATLAVLVFEALVQATPQAGLARAALGFLRAAAAGFVLGGLGAGALILVVRRRWVPDHLENAVSLTTVLAAFTAANHIQPESGLLAATVMGCVVGNVLREEARPIRVFKENLQVLLIGALFVVLAARLSPADLTRALSAPALAFVALLILVVRPLAALLATVGTSLDWRERAFVACVAPRGIVAAAVGSVFALRLGGTDLQGGDLLGPLVFLVIVVTVAVYGLSVAPVARRLGLAEAAPEGLLILGAQPWARALAQVLGECGALVRLIDNNPRNIRAARRMGLSATDVDALNTQAFEDIELRGIGRFIAVTRNDAVNSLAAARFQRVLERSHVYLLQPHTAGEPGDHAPSARIRSLFADGVDYDAIEERIARGARFVAEPVREGFSLNRWQERHGAAATPLAVVGADGGVRLHAHDEELAPRPGEWLIALVGRDEEGALPGRALEAGLVV